MRQQKTDQYKENINSEESKIKPQEAFDLLDGFFFFFFLFFQYAKHIIVGRLIIIQHVITMHIFTFIPPS